MMDTLNDIQQTIAHPTAPSPIPLSLVGIVIYEIVHNPIRFAIAIAIVGSLPFGFHLFSGEEGCVKFDSHWATAERCYNSYEDTQDTF